MPRFSVALVLCLAAAPAWANLGVPIKEGESPNCPATRGVFVRKQDGARFAPDRYGVFTKDVLIPAEDAPRKRIEFTRGRGVLSGLLKGRRAYLFWANGEPRGTGITTSSWKNPVDGSWTVEGTKAPALKTLGSQWGEVTGPLSGTWVLTECRPVRGEGRG